MKNKTAITQLLTYLRRYNSADVELIEYAESLLETERDQIVSAWIKGNAEGWEMTTDWPQHGERYYEERYENEKTFQA